MIDLHHGDCTQVMRGLAEASVDAIVTDPPYHLTNRGGGPHGKGEGTPYARAQAGASSGGFMGMKWDGGDVALRPETWAEALRVLKPGGYLLAFGGTRTYHRMACAIEDAGFEIRDQIGWAFGSGFPKSHNGPWGGTALKPAWEPICVARKPLIGTVEQNWKEHGTGALNIDGCRVQTAEVLRAGAGGIPCRHDEHTPRGRADESSANSRYASEGGTDFAMTPGPRGGDPAGRWPANLIHDGSEEVVALFPREAGAAAPVTLRRPDKFRSTYGAFKGDRDEAGSTFHGDTGSAARFFAQFPQEDACHTKSLAPIAQPCSSLQSVLGASVQGAAAIWPNLAGIVSSDTTAPFTPVTPSESKTISELVITATAPIGSGSLREWQQEKHSLCGSRVSVAATRNQTDTTTITASLCRSDGSVAHATFSITPTNLDLGAAASRFRYCAKADRADRNDGCEYMERKPLNWSSGTQNPGSLQAENTDRTSPNHHPTVKPTDLMRYLCRLVTPKGGLVLDPFMGSGSTGRGAVLEGFRFIGIELDVEYLEIARARIDAARRQGYQTDLLDAA